MMKSRNPEFVIQSAIQIIESNQSSEIRLNANGGNSVLIVCEPSCELEYVTVIRNTMTAEKYEIIDLNELLSEFVSKHREQIEESFELLSGSVHQIFRAPKGEESPDLFKLIIEKITESFSKSKIPVLIHAGALYGTEIDNIHIMEHETVMRSALPLVVLYFGTKENDRLMFLNVRSASRYRCVIVD